MSRRFCFTSSASRCLSPDQEAQGLADKPSFALTASIALLALLVVLNVLGLGVGKWVNNLGGIGTGITAATLILLGAIVTHRFGITVTAADFRIPADIPAGGCLRRDLFWLGRA